MRKFVTIVMLLCATSSGAAELTETELRWLRAGWPVLTYAEEQGLQVDIVVQPEDAGAAPFAMGFAQGRCQLVLSMRDRPDAESVLAGLSPELAAVAIEAMTAHELAHCWRYAEGAWRALPAGFVAPVVSGSGQAAEVTAIRRRMQETRREEGFADLVGLAWVAQHHPEQYAAVHDWFTRLRNDQPVDGSFHDTRVWIRLAQNPEAFGGQSNPFEQAQALWARGLSQADQ